MNLWIAIAEAMTGVAYTGLGFLTVYEMVRERQTRGWSQFGLAFAVMAFACGPHHLLNATMRFLAAPVVAHTTAAVGSTGMSMPAASGSNVASLAALLVGLPAGLIFVGLRIEALRGGAGDRTIHGGASLVPWLATVVAMVGGAIVAYQVSRSAAIDWPFAAVNLVLAASYLAVGWYVLTTQLVRHDSRKHWSMSGVALGSSSPPARSCTQVMSLNATG